MQGRIKIQAKLFRRNAALKITSIELLNVRIPFQEPFRISSGEVTHTSSLIVCLQTAEGYIGYGEAAPMDGTFYSKESPDYTWQCLSQFLPTLIGREFYEASDVSLKQLDSFFARAAVETALWDLLAKEKSVPLYKLLGGSKRKIECGLAVGIYDSIDELLAVIGKYIDWGYKRLKIKIKPGWDEEPVRQVRKAFGDIPLFVDANAAYSIEDAEVFQRLDAYNLQMYEQPFAADALQEHAQLAKTVQTPICLDEGVRTIQDAKTVIELESAKIVNIKLQRVGGFGPALEIYQLCHDAGLDLWCGSMPELGVGQAAGLHLAALEGFNHPTDLGPSLRFFKDDLIKPFIEMDGDGTVTIPDKVGIGFEVHQEKIDRYLVRREKW